MAKVANGRLGCIKKFVASRFRENSSAPLLWPGKPTPGVLCAVLGSPVQDRELLEEIQWRVTKMLRGWKPYKERLRDLYLFSLEKRSLGEDLLNVDQ